MVLIVRGALRGLRSGRGATALAFALLSLAFAAGIITFSVVDAVAIRQVPYAAPTQLVDLSLYSPVAGTRLLASPSDYLMWRERALTLGSLGAARFSSVRLEIDGTPTDLSARRVTTTLFDVLGVKASVGRLFGPEQEDRSDSNVVVLGNELWVRRFGADKGVIGRRLRFEDGMREVIGVLPAGVWYPIVAGPPPDLYLPYVLTPADGSDSRCCVFVVGRLRPRVSIDQARADIQRFSSTVVVPLQDAVVGSSRSTMLVVLCAVGLVLVVACVNVAVVLLARAVIRRQEFAIREATGASRARLAADNLLEAVMLATASVLVGLVVSRWGVEVAKQSLPPMLTRVSTIAIDGRVLAASLATAVSCGLVFGTAPAWFASRRGLAAHLTTSGSLAARGRRGRILPAFLVANLALVSMLLAATTLVVGTFIRLMTADLGFDRRNVMTVGFEQSLVGVPRRDRSAAAATIRAEVIARARSVPGVVEAAISVGGRVPLSGVSGKAAGEGTEFDRVTPEYFRALGIQVIRGRTFESSDLSGAPAVVIINDAAARASFAGLDPIGQPMWLGNGSATVVGVVRGGHIDGPEAPIRPAVFVPASQNDLVEASGTAMGLLFIRTRTDARALASRIRAAIRPALAMEPGPTGFVDDHFRFLTSERRFNAGLMAMFGVLAVVIGAVSLYGTTTFLVAQQVRSIGVRMALGASPSHVMHAVLHQALLQAGLGAAIGLAGAWAISAALEHAVFGIRATDPVVLISVCGLLAITCIGAALVPALRAARLDPVAVMRSQ